MIPDSQSQARTERLLRQLASGHAPSADAQARVQRMVRSQLRAPILLKQARDAVEPSPRLAATLWNRVLSSLDPLSHLSLWQRVREAIRPTADAQDLLWNRLLPRLEPSYSRAFVSRPVKWVAAFAVVLVAVRISPLLFLAPATIADSPVTLLSSDGDVEVLMGALWQQPLRERTTLTLASPTSIQTQRGTATVTLHDDAVIRFANATRGQILDLSDRPQPSQQESTFALEDGEIWVLGVVPKHVRAIEIVTNQGRILVHEGSVSIRQNGSDVTVRVFDRSAIVSRHGKQLSLVAGQQTILTHDSDLVVTTMDESMFQEPWATENLNRDAAHQREIAQLQQERRAAGAGILPGTTLYPVKRLAETVDVLFSLSEEERARKLITQANTRLNEAAALLQTGGASSEAESALKQYKDTMLQVASGSGGSAEVQSLIQTEIVDAGSATVGAALPGDPSYVLKQTVDETIAALPNTVSKPDVEGEVLLDELAAAKRQADQGDTQIAKEKLDELSDSIASLNATGALTLVSADVREEAKAAVKQLSDVVGPAQGAGLTLGAPEKEVVLPQHPARTIILRPLTQEQVTAKAQEIRGRIFLFGTKKAQYDALADQLRLLVGNPDQGRILRELAKVLPRTGLAQKVIRDIQVLHDEVQEQVTASGGVTE